MTVAVIVLAYFAVTGWLSAHSEHQRAELATQRADAAALLAEMNERHYRMAMDGWRDCAEWWAQRNATVLSGWRAALQLLVAKELGSHAIAKDVRAQETVH